MKRITSFTFINIIILCFCCYASYSQSLLKNTVSIKANKQPLHDVLTIMSNDANVTFSYNTKVVNRDSLVSVNAVNKPLGEVLRSLFDAGFEFKESGSYIIIRRKPVPTSGILTTAPSRSEHYFITGKVVNEETGEAITEASVYEKQQLLSSMTDDQGSFSIRLKNKYPEAQLSISKDGYVDTSIVVAAKFNQTVTIALRAQDPEPIVAAQRERQVNLAQEKKTYDVVERKWIGRVLFGTKQKIQSLNLKKFYTTKAYQFSIIPGVGTHGKMNSQVINHTSINLIGGYSGGVDGFEVGTFFNIVKNDVRHVQLAGLFNTVGGDVSGVQAASVYNDVAGEVKGVQIAGLFNLVKKQIQGFQIATLYNRAHSVNGLQIALINSTDTQEGTSIGFLNFSKTTSGKRKVGFLVRVPRG